MECNRAQAPPNISNHASELHHVMVGINRHFVHCSFHFVLCRHRFVRAAALFKFFWQQRVRFPDEVTLQGRPNAAQGQALTLDVVQHGFFDAAPCCHACA